MLRPARSVLILDDDDAVRAVVQDILEEEGYRVLAAPSPATARAILAEEDVALVLLDHLQSSDGDDARQALARSDGHRPPIVLFSAVPDPAPIAASVGADTWLRKPFEIEDLLAVVRRYARQDA